MFIVFGNSLMRLRKRGVINANLFCPTDACIMLREKKGISQYEI